MQLKLLVIKRKNRLANGNMNDNYVLIKISTSQSGCNKVLRALF